MTLETIHCLHCGEVDFDYDELDELDGSEEFIDFSEGRCPECGEDLPEEEIKRP